MLGPFRIPGAMSTGDHQLTEDQQGGTMPPAEATAEAPSSDQGVATVAVADEPANISDNASEPAAEAASPDSTTEAEEAPGGVADPVVEPATAEAAPEAPAAVADAPEPVATADAPVRAPEPGDSAEAAPAAETASVNAGAAADSASIGDAPDASASETSAGDEARDEAAEPGAAEPAAAEPAAAEPGSEPDSQPGPVAEIAPVAAAAPARPTGPEPTTMEELLAEQDSEIKSFKHGDVVEGTVVRIDKDEMLVDIGAKSEGVVSNRELFGRSTESQPALAVGDVVLVYVLQPESPEGHVVLSLRRAGLERKWRSMQEQFEAGVIIEAPVIDHNKGGLIVDCGIRGFVPISQIVDFPRRPQNDQPRDAAQEIAEKLQPFVGRKLRLKILEVNRKANRLILSEKVALYEERREKRDELFSSLQVGQKVTGNVRSIAPFGVFIDLGGIDGLVHKSELSWNKVNNPEGGYRVGEEVEAEVIDINHERGRISLSIRRLQPDPWHSTVADFNVGDIIDGTVTKLVNFGAFVRVRDGLEGLIHISELSNQRVAHPGDVVHEGQQLKLRIISLDSERHRLGLSLKQAEEAPARAAPEAVLAAPAGAAPSQPRERDRGERRGGRASGERERSYAATDAVQEPEGGIDTTLAAAFAGVREQLAAAELAEAPAAEADDTAEADADQAPVAGAGEATEAPVADATDTADTADAADTAGAADTAEASPAVEAPQAAPVAEAPEDAPDGAEATKEAAQATTDEVTPEAEHPETPSGKAKASRPDVEEVPAPADEPAPEPSEEPNTDEPATGDEPTVSAEEASLTTEAQADRAGAEAALEATPEAEPDTSSTADTESTPETAEPA
jgi:small subunit ribosomal protein S1